MESVLLNNCFLECKCVPRSSFLNFFLCGDEKKRREMKAVEGDVYRASIYTKREECKITACFRSVCFVLRGNSISFFDFGPEKSEVPKKRRNRTQSLHLFSYLVDALSNRLALVAWERCDLFSLIDLKSRGRMAISIKIPSFFIANNDALCLREKSNTSTDKRDGRYRGRID